MSRWRVVSSFALGSSLLLACRPPLIDPTDETSGESESTGDGDGDELGDGDGEPGDGDGDGEVACPPVAVPEEPEQGEVYCDLGQFPALEPMWLEVVEPVGVPRGVAVNANSIFTHFYYDEYVDEISRRTLGGQIDWTVYPPDVFWGSPVRADEEHVYLESTDGLRRLTFDGQVDAEWEFTDDFYLNHFDTSSARVLLAGGLNGNGLSGWIDKSDSLVVALDEDLAVDSSRFVIPWSTGGHVAASTRADDQHLYLRGYEGAMFEVDLPFPIPPTPRFMHERPEGLLVAVAHIYPPDYEAWMVLVDRDGCEAWRKRIAPCGLQSAHGVGPALAAGPEFIWASVPVVVAPDHVLATLLVQFGFDGEVLGNYVIAGVPEGVPKIAGIATHGDKVVVIGTSSTLPDNAISSAWIARLL